MPERTVDVCIVGAGPAGAALALRLAQLGRLVAIVEKTSFPRTHIGESLTGGIWPLLETLGVRDVVESTAFLCSQWATVDWAGNCRRYRLHGGPGLQVDRARFDALLLDCAAAMPGVRVYLPARILDHVYLEGKWVIRLDNGETVHAAYLADAAGRARILPGAKRPIGMRTLAIYAYWSGVTDCEDGDTLVEAGPEEWYWGAPLPGGEFNATVFVDPVADPDYRRLLRRSKLIGSRLANASPCSETRVCDATAFADQLPVTSASIKVGDAALSIDPLSSQGVQTAVGTALHAAVVLNTMIDRPGDRDLAMEFYRSRLRDSADFHSAAAAAYYGQQFAAGGGDFWKKRAKAARPERQRLTASLSPEVPIQLSPKLQFGNVAIADSSYVIRQEGASLGAKSFAFVGNGIPVAPLLQEINGAMSSIEVLQRWSRRMPAVQAVQLLDWAWAEELIECGEFPALRR